MMDILKSIAVGLTEKNLKLSKFRISVRNFWPNPRRRRRRNASELL